MIGQGWTLTQQGRERQLKRFEALGTLGRFDGRTVLELGCGRGDFYRFLLSRGERPHYQGVDPSPELVAEGRALSRDDESCRFVQDDVGVFQPSMPFDYVIASEPLREGAQVPAGAELSDALTRVFSWCTLGAAACFPSARAHGRSTQAVRVDPAAALKAALRLTPAVRLIHDYLPARFALFLYRTPSIGPGADNGDAKGATRDA